MMNQPMGRLEALQYREAAFYTGDGRVGTVEVLRVHFRAPDGDHYEHDLPNGPWALSNNALQFMALWGYQPTTLDGTMHDAHDDQILLPLAPTPDGGYGLAESALQGGEKALEDAEWFGSPDDTDDDSGPSDGPGGGGSPDPGTGNRGAVDDPDQGGVSAKMAGEDSNAGVEVTVE